MENKSVNSHQVLTSGKSQRTVNSVLTHHSNTPVTGFLNPLTREMIAQKCKTDKLNLIKNINLWGNEIDNLSLLREMPNLEIVSLSHNRVTTMRDLSYCSKIQEIFLRKNLISDLQEVAHLSRLPNLRVLWLSHNPCADHPYYRPYIVRKLPSLVKLDNAEVKKEERIAASRLNFDQIFKENPSIIATQQSVASSSQS